MHPRKVAAVTAGAVDAGESDAGDSGTDAGGVAPSCTTVSDCPGAASASIDCVAGECVIVSCRAYMTDCDGDYATGCESHPPTDAANCGTCGTVISGWRQERRAGTWRWPGCCAGCVIDRASPAAVVAHTTNRWRLRTW